MCMIIQWERESIGSTVPKCRVILLYFTDPLRSKARISQHPSLTGLLPASAGKQCTWKFRTLGFHFIESQPNLGF